MSSGVGIVSIRCHAAKVAVRKCCGLHRWCRVSIRCHAAKVAVLNDLFTTLKQSFNPLSCGQGGSTQADAGERRDPAFQSAVMRPRWQYFWRRSLPVNPSVSIRCHAAKVAVHRPWFLLISLGFLTDFPNQRLAAASSPSTHRCILQFFFVIAVRYTLSGPDFGQITCIR